MIEIFPPGFPQFPILEIMEKQDQANYRHLMFTLPIILNAHTVVETGLGNGHSTRIFLEALSLNQGNLHTFEMKPMSYVIKDIRETITKYDLKSRWYLHVGESTKLHNSTEGVSFSQTGVQSIDFLFLDSDHSYKNVYDELDTFKPFLSPKAVIMSDDAWTIGEGLDLFCKRHPGENPTDPYYAVRDWALINDWKILHFTELRGFPPENIQSNGKIIAYRQL